MARPLKKSPKLDRDLRIPVTAEQHALVRKAVEALGMDMTTWARPILLDAAAEALGNAKKKRRTGDSNPSRA